MHGSFVNTRGGLTFCCRLVYFMNGKFGSEMITIDEGDILEVCGAYWTRVPPLTCVCSSMSLPTSLYHLLSTDTDSIRRALRGWMAYVKLAYYASAVPTDTMQVPGVTQPMIQPGASFTYRYNVDQYGFYHLHAHSSMCFPLSYCPIVY